MKNMNSRVEILKRFGRLPTFTRRDVNLFQRSGYGTLLSAVINHSRNLRYTNIEVVEASSRTLRPEDLISHIEQWQTYCLEIVVVRDAMLEITSIDHSGNVSMRALVSIQPSFIARGLDMLIDELAIQRRAVERMEEERKKLAQCRGRLFQMELD